MQRRGNPGTLLMCNLVCSKLVNVEYKLVYKHYGDFTKKLKIELPYDPEIPLLGIYSKTNKQNTQPKTLIWKYTCIPMFIATSLFTIAKVHKQSKCLTTDKWIKKM